MRADEGALLRRRGARWTLAVFETAAMCRSSAALASASITGPICTAGSRGSPIFSSSRRTLDHRDHLVGDVGLHAEEPQRRAALARRAERRGHDVVGHLLGQRGRVDHHRIDAARLRDQGTIGPSLAARARLIAQAVSVEPVKATPATSRCAVIAAPIRPSPTIRRARPWARPASWRIAHRLGRDARRLLGRLGEDRIAGDEGRRDLADEDGEREIPRADAHEHAAPAMAQDVLLARRARHRFPGPEHAAGLRGVIAAEIDRLAQLRDRVVDGLAAFVLEQRDEPAPPRLHSVGRSIERRCAHVGTGAVP